MAGRGREILFELVAIGGVVKASAIDPATGIEVSIFGPASAGRGALERLAARKLERRLQREA